MAEELSRGRRSPALGDFRMPMRSHPGGRAGKGHHTEDNMSRALCCWVRDGGAAHAALQTMLGAWTLSSKQWGVTEKQQDGNCSVERLLWG